MITDKTLGDFMSIMRKVIEKGGLESRLVLRSMIETQDHIRYLHSVGGYEFITVTFSSIIQMCVEVDRVKRLQEEGSDISESLDELTVPWGLPDIIFRLTKIQSSVIKIIEANQKVLDRSDKYFSPSAKQ